MRKLHWLSPLGGGRVLPHLGTESLIESAGEVHPTKRNRKKTKIIQQIQRSAQHAKAPSTESENMNKSHEQLNLK